MKRTKKKHEIYFDNFKIITVFLGHFRGLKDGGSLVHDSDNNDDVLDCNIDGRPNISKLKLVR